MADYDLRPDEAFVHKSSRVWVDDGPLDELILTSKRLVLLSTVRKGWRDSEQVVSALWLKRIKVFQGHAQALVVKQSGGSPGLDVYYDEGTLHFRFVGKREAAFWSQKIDEIVTGTPANVVSPDAPAAEQVTQAMKDTVSALKDIVGSKSKATPAAAPATAPVPVAGDCVSCGAPISGIRGRSTICPYCDSSNQL